MRRSCQVPTLAPFRRAPRWFQSIQSARRSNSASHPPPPSTQERPTQPGSWGSVNGFIYNYTARLLTGAFAVDPSDTNVQFLTSAADEARSNTLSACGRGPSLAAGSSALRGTITEGAGAEGCTMTFPAAFPRTPVCMVSSPTGPPLGGYAATERTLTIRNPGGSGNRYPFICAPQRPASGMASRAPLSLRLRPAVRFIMLSSRTIAADLAALPSLPHSDGYQCQAPSIPADQT
jgi:hypothetical protein